MNLFRKKYEFFSKKNMNFNIFFNSDPLLGIYVTHSESQIAYKLSFLSRLAPLWTVCSLVFSRRIHLRQPSEPVVLDPQTFVTAFSKVSQWRKHYRGRNKNSQIFATFWPIKAITIDSSNLHPIKGPYGNFGRIHVEELGQSFETHPSI